MHSHYAPVLIILFHFHRWKSNSVIIILIIIRSIHILSSCPTIDSTTTTKTISKMGSNRRCGRTEWYSISTHSKFHCITILLLYHIFRSRRTKGIIRPYKSKYDTIVSFTRTTIHHSSVTDDNIDDVDHHGSYPTTTIIHESDTSFIAHARQQ